MWPSSPPLQSQHGNKSTQDRNHYQWEWYVLVWAAWKCVCTFMMNLAWKVVKVRAGGLALPDAFLEVTFMLLCSNDSWQKNGSLALILRIVTSRVLNQYSGGQQMILWKTFLSPWQLFKKASPDAPGRWPGYGTGSLHRILMSTRIRWIVESLPKLRYVQIR